MRPEDRLAVAAIVLRALRIDTNGVGVIDISARERQIMTLPDEPHNSQLLLGLLLQRVLGDSLEGLLDVDGLLRRRLEVGDVPLRLTPRHGTLLSDL